MIALTDGPVNQFTADAVAATFGSNTHKEFEMLRQGDVLLVPVDQIPADAKPRKGKDRLILARGEVTGHHHSLVAERGGEIDVLETKAGEVFARIMAAPAREVHQEHAAIEVPPGNYQVVIQREYHPQEIRRVAD